MDKELLSEINAFYNSLEIKQKELVSDLSCMGFKLESGWYNGHYYKNDVGEWNRESFPIPVVSVIDLCDIEIQFDEITVSTKLKRDFALEYSFEEISGYEFEAYGVEDYLTDFYHKGLALEEMKENIKGSNESEIGFSFVFSFDIDGKEIYDLVKLLKNEGFYY